MEPQGLLPRGPPAPAPHTLFTGRAQGAKNHVHLPRQRACFYLAPSAYPEPTLTASDGEGISHPWTFPTPDHLLAMDHHVKQEYKTGEERTFGTRQCLHRQRGAWPVTFCAQIKEFKIGKMLLPTCQPLNAPSHLPTRLSWRRLAWFFLLNSGGSHRCPGPLRSRELEAEQTQLHVRKASHVPPRKSRAAQTWACAQKTLHVRRENCFQLPKRTSRHSDERRLGVFDAVCLQAPTPHRGSHT